VHVDRDLLTDEGALGQRLMPTGAAQGIDVVIGGPYNSGILAGGTRYEYQDAPAEISAKVARITAIARRHNVPIKAAAQSSRLLTRPRPRSSPAPACRNASQKTTRR
jgi:aryl-alcohol dehydrogenase-like predicted oxidoreductase